MNSDPEEGKRCFFITVDYEYFDFYGFELLAGRKFSKEFPTDMDAAILNEEAVKMFGYEGLEKYLKEKILLGGLGEQIIETVGVIKNYHHKSLKDAVQPVIFTLTEGDPNGRNNYFSVKLDTRNVSHTLSLWSGTDGMKCIPESPLNIFSLVSPSIINTDSTSNSGISLDY